MRYKCIVTYDGTNFFGFQSQKKLRTVQTEIEITIFKVLNESIKIYAAGRTDSKVHALAQVFHFDTNIIMSAKRMQSAINRSLPKDIYITNIEIVSEEFHSRFISVKKEYHYYLDYGTYNPLLKNYRYYYPYGKKIDWNNFKDAAKVFIGTHDFKSFTKNHKLENTERTIYSIDFDIEETLIIIKIVGDGFLHNMVRILIGMLLEVGRGNYTANDLKLIMKEKNRQLAPKIVPPNGLYLYKVYYK